LSLIGKITEQLEKKNSQGVNIGKSQDGGNVISRGDDNGFWINTFTEPCFFYQ
jgi:hypothetical protein